ncbi:MAG: AI-2E family transporter [Paludibacteraceae bacterium]|nr:AI-2E family transporter [Prevotellaceae bacterium]
MKFSLSKPFTFDRTVRLLIVTTITIFTILTLKYLSKVLLPFFIAWLLAYLFYPGVKFVQHKLRFRNRSLSVLTVLTSVIALIVALFWILIPIILSELAKFKTIILKYTENSDSLIIPQKWGQALHKFLVSMDAGQLFDKQIWGDTAKGLFPHAWELLSNSFSVAISLFLVFIVILYLFFIMKDYGKITHGFISLIPAKHQEFVSSLLKDMEFSMNKYYRGQSLVALIVGILFAIGFSIIGLPLGILMGIVLGLLNLIPYMQTLSIPLSILLMLLKVIESGDSLWISMLSLLIVYVVVQMIQDMYLVPKIMGRAMGMNPALILLSLSIWGALLGVLGLIIALPATTLAISYYKRYILTRIDEVEEEPASNSPDEKL